MIYFLLFIQQLISSSTHLVADDISEKLHPIHIVLIRGIFTCLAFAVWFAIRKGTWKRVSRADVPLILGLGLLNISINQILFIWGVKFTTAPNASLAYALTPVFVVFIARMVYKQSVSMLKWIGVVTAIAGAVIVLNERGLAVQADQSVGNIMVLSASISWAVYTFYSSRLIERYGAVQAIALTFFSGLLLYVPVWLAMPVQAPLVDVLSAAGSSSTWFQLFYLGVITSGVGYGLWYVALSKLPSSNVAVFNNLQPVLTSVLALLLFGLEPSGAYVIGGSLALLGVVVTQRS
ncbi:MAG: DMT family transporter [Ignavibacteria bacterium]|jgi:RarD protein